MAFFSLDSDRGVQIVRFEDAQILDEAYAQKVGIRLLQLAGDTTDDALLLNLSKVRFAASAMIGQLVSLKNKCRQSSMRLAICELNECLCEAIKLTRIDQILDVYPTEADAMAQLSQPKAL